MPTIKEIADATGRGKSTVSRAVKELGLRESGHAKADGARGALIIDAEGASMLADYLTKNVEAKPQADDDEQGSQPHIDIEALVSVYKERIDDLKQQIDGLNAQLAAKDEQIKELSYKCSFKNTRTIGGFKALDINDMEAIYRMAK